jgi:hypothetical protein
MNEMTRRQLLQSAVALAANAGMNANAGSAQPASKERRSDSLDRQNNIELYCSTLSVVAGDHVSAHVSTTARHFDLQIARIGREETVVWTREQLPGAFHPTPEDAWQNGCRWPASVHIVIPAIWKSGYYQIKAITADEGMPHTESLAFIVVRPVQPTAKILLVLCTNTYEAYNPYGGASFYTKKNGEPSSGVFNDGGEHRVSFQRPWSPGFLWRAQDYPPPSWDSHPGFHTWESVMLRWLEQKGYAVDYAISSDLEFHPALLSRYRLMLSVGHDEYWSWSMRDTVEAFIAQGGNVCFFSGNVAFWQIRYEDMGHSMVCYKHDYEEDPYFKAGRKPLTATCWSSHLIGRPETRLTGLSTLYAGLANYFGVTPQGIGGYVVYRPGHWVFKDSGLAYGDVLGRAGNIMRYEVDGCPLRLENGLPYPASDYDGPASLEILGFAPAGLIAGTEDANGQPVKPDPALQRSKLSQVAREIFGSGDEKTLARISHNHAVMSIYTNNGTVFCAGTTDWTNGLKGHDPAVEQVTRNLLDRLSM